MPEPGQDTTGGSARRRELLDKALAYVMERGVSDLSLRPLAAAIGTSPRVLLYLFGSKDGLVRAVLARAREAELETVSAITGEAGQTDVDLDALWAWLTAEEHRPILRLFFEAYVRSLHQTEPWRDFASTAVSQWLDLLRPGDPSAEPPGPVDAETTLMLAVIRGLLLDLVATGDTARVTAAFTRYLDADATAPVRG